MHFLGLTGSKTTQVYLNLDLWRTLHMLKLFSGKKLVEIGLPILREEFFLTYLVSGLAIIACGTQHFETVVFTLADFVLSSHFSSV